MKKRLFMVLAVLALTVCMLPMVVGAETVDPATCSHAGATYTEIPTTGTHTRYCSLCDTTVTEQCTGCDFTNCSLCGSDLLGIHPIDETGHCIGCGNCTDTKGLVTKYDETHHWKECLLGHHFDDELYYEPHSFSAATCTEPGKCECGAVNPNDATPKHDIYIASQKGTQPQHSIKCSRDGCTYFEWVDCSYTVNSSPSNSCTAKCDCGRQKVKDGHTEETLEAVAPTCTSTGLTEGKKCSVCGEILLAQETVDKLPHDYAAPTCTEPGKCNCGAIDPENPEALGHEKAEDSGVIAHTNGKTHGFACGRCGKDVSENHEEAPIGEAKPNSCTEDGLTAGKKCPVCKYIIEEQQVIPAAHTPVTDAAVAPTCEKTGLTEGKHCDVCDEVLVKQEVIKALGHKWNDGVVTKEASYTDTGIITYTCLNDASHTYEEATPVLKVPYDPNLDSVPRTGNIFVEWLYAIFA
ncbi:MAG: hypothetical protein J6J12_01655 [Oscillospiraceae bacterium]|nr:hypothetical protein [Oscillospiraceae bacterium]